MALIMCPECERKISETASFCPKCGCQLTPEKLSEIREKVAEIQEKNRIGLKLFGIIVAISLSLIIAFALFDDQSEEGKGQISAEPQANKEVKQTAKIRRQNIDELNTQAEMSSTIGMKFVYIPAGEFMMGSNNGESDEKPVHKVKISKGFYIGITEVTQAQYRVVMGHNPSSFKGDNNPVERVSWDDAIEFCKKLSQKENRAYTLPTEAQWEYACRAGTSTAFSFGNDKTSLGNYAWFSDNSYGKTHSVGQKKRNAFGLYDMHGNVLEWCLDRDGSYSSRTQTDPIGSNNGQSCVLRGGAWGFKSSNCRSTSRISLAADFRYFNGGFRLVSPDFHLAEAKQSVKITQQNLGRPNAQTEIPLTIGMKFIYIPAGEFMMGSNNGESDEKPVHKVKISKGFYISQTEVTVGQYLEYLNSGGDSSGVDFNAEDCPIKKTGSRYVLSGSIYGLNESQPMVDVNWYGAQEFCKWLIGRNGKTYRLPTEAEWEYACRAGSTTAYCFGNSDSLLSDYAWYDSSNKTYPVGQKKPNTFDLYDMHGNVMEWCQDWYDKVYYSNSPNIDPKGPGTGQARVLRGGSWVCGSSMCRSAYRARCAPELTLNYYPSGFRLVSPDFQQVKSNN